MIRKLLYILLGVVALVIVAVAAVYARSVAMLRKTYALDAAVPIPNDSASIARGEHIARAIGSCTTCHGEQLQGAVYANQMPVMRMVPSNLTRGRGGVGALMTDVDWVNAIRHGVGRDRRSLIFMVSETYQVMSDEDLGSLIAYLKQIPPVDNELPPTEIGPVGRALAVFRKAPLISAENVDHDRKQPARVAREVTPEYGYYLARLGGCIGCHGSNLAGQRVPGATPDIPPAANLTPSGIGHYSDADFIRALREGKRPDGSPINPFMPLTATKHLTDDEILAIRAYLRTVPAADGGESTKGR